MSTKNLARSVIEGGRAPYNKFERRHSNAVQRSHERQIEQRLLGAVDLDSYVFPRRESVYRGFDDKLSPAERWLASQVGRPWDKVRSEMLQRFDTRTTAGRHIVFCHLLQMVDLGTDALHWYPYKVVVDAFGILRRARSRRSRFWRQRPEPLPEPEDALLRFLNGRRVAQVGSHLYWCTPTPAGGFRQQRELGSEERARWLRVPGWFRDQQKPEPVPVTERS
jgi:hypothetical protein